jgi:hypothetical protein
MMQLLLDFGPLDTSSWSNDTGQASTERGELGGHQERTGVMVEDVQNYGRKGWAEVRGIFDYSPQMTYADVSYYLFYGYLNTTLGFTTINQQKCIGLIAEFYVNLTRDVPAQVRTQRFRDFAVTTSQVLRNVDPAWKACLWTVDDGYDLYWLQGVSLDDLFRILWNLVYRFGNLVDRVSELVTAFSLGLV